MIDYNKISGRARVEVTELASKIETLGKMEDGKNALKVDTEVLEQKAKRSFDELHIARDKAISLFNMNSQALYDLPGKLLIDITKTGFKYRIDIERMGSTGIGNMNTFFYDFVLDEIWSEKDPYHKFLVHDSNIFEGVDSRQVAHAIELAARRTKEKGFQYILMMNSDNVPYTDFSNIFDLEPYIRLRLGDHDPSAGLLGRRV